MLQEAAAIERSRCVHKRAIVSALEDKILTYSSHSCLQGSSPVSNCRPSQSTPTRALPALIHVRSHRVLQKVPSHRGVFTFCRTDLTWWYARTSNPWASSDAAVRFSLTGGLFLLPALLALRRERGGGGRAPFAARGLGQSGGTAAAVRRRLALRNSAARAATGAETRPFLVPARVALRGREPPGPPPRFAQASPRTRAHTYAALAPPASATAAQASEPPCKPRRDSLACS